MARKAGIRKEDVLNTLSYAKFKQAVRPGQGRSVAFHS